MSEPQRIQRRRAKGWRMPEGALYVGRPTKWGNPFRIYAEQIVVTDDGRDWYCPEGAQQGAVDLFALHIGPMGIYEYDDDRLAELRALAGRDFACWCPLDQPCHADVLLEIANGTKS